MAGVSISSGDSSDRDGRAGVEFTKPTPSLNVVPIVPCNNMSASAAFYQRLGLVSSDPVDGEYQILTDPATGAMALHLQPAVEGWLVPGRNPFALYIYPGSAAAVDALAVEFRSEIIGASKKAEKTPWGMYEFAVNGPDETLIRVGCRLSDAGDAGAAAAGREQM